MNADDILKLVFGAVILGFALISRLVKTRQQAGQAGTPSPAAPAAMAPPASTAVPQQRVVALLAEMRRRGIVPPPGLQALAAQAAASQAAATATAAPAYAATPAYAAQPAYAAPPPQGKARQQRPERLPDRTRSAAPASPFSPLGVPGAFAPAAAAPASTGGMLARAFGDPASARNAVILAEVLKPPVALR